MHLFSNRDIQVVLGEVLSPIFTVLILLHLGTFSELRNPINGSVPNVRTVEFVVVHNNVP